MSYLYGIGGDEMGPPQEQQTNEYAWVGELLKQGGIIAASIGGDLVRKFQEEQARNQERRAAAQRPSGNVQGGNEKKEPSFMDSEIAGMPAPVFLGLAVAAVIVLKKKRK